MVVPFSNLSHSKGLRMKPLRAKGLSMKLKRLENETTTLSKTTRQPNKHRINASPWAPLQANSSLFFFFITLGLELSDTNVYEP